MKPINIELLEFIKCRTPSTHYKYVLLIRWIGGRRSLIFRRYNEFYEFQCSLLKLFPRQINHVNDMNIPLMPTKVFLRTCHQRQIAEQRFPLLKKYLMELMKCNDSILCCNILFEFFSFHSSTDLQSQIIDKKELIENDISSLISSPIQKRRLIVRHPYKSKDIEVKSDDHVIVLDASDRGWALIQKDNFIKGFIPSQCLENNDVLFLNKSDNGWYVSDTTKSASKSDEDSLIAGFLYEVISTGPDGWWKTSSNKLVPSFYLHKINEKYESILEKWKNI
ncbi:hypothetical protein SNEBB_010407 [Seison nebaliae]|nr:hypothetical protein SNEBB_010407 [Seison nebaliae]